MNNKEIVESRLANITQEQQQLRGLQDQAVAARDPPARSQLRHPWADSSGVALAAAGLVLDAAVVGRQPFWHSSRDTERGGLGAVLLPLLHGL